MLPLLPQMFPGMMKKILLLFALLFPATIVVAFEPRCGTDLFGNTVCLDKSGVQSAAPEGVNAGASAVPPAAPAAGRDGGKKRVRCGIDPFGNTVCAPQFRDN